MSFRSVRAYGPPKRIVRAEVEQEFAPRVQVGDKVVVEDETRGTQWPGKVIRIADWYKDAIRLTHRRSRRRELHAYLLDVPMRADALANLSIAAY